MNIPSPQNTIVSCGYTITSTTIQAGELYPESYTNIGFCSRLQWEVL